MTTATETPLSVEHACCESCGCFLYESLAGELRCVRARCPRNGEVIAVLAVDVGSLRAGA